MKPLTILILLSIIALTHCESNLPIIGKKGKTKAEKTQYAIFENCWFGSLLTPPQTEYRVVDNNDGTISLNKVDITGTDICIIPGLGKKEIFTTLYYIKKCVQGQVYRSAQNDCKGTGTAANYYGAQKLQWCAAGSGCDENSRPAQVACIQDKLNNLDWNNLEYYNSKSLSRAEFVNFVSIFSKNQDFPSLITDYYWLSGRAYNLLGDYDNFKISQAEFLYVRCSKGV